MSTLPDSVESTVTSGARVRVLGIPFFNGTVGEAVDESLRQRGLLVAPSGPNLAEIDRMPVYAHAVRSADIAITDSGLMVGLWNLLRRPRLSRTSGLGFLRALTADARLRAERILWVAPDEQTSAHTAEWASRQGLPPALFHVAPRYKRERVEDAELASLVMRERPSCIFICIGGGTQEPLGYWLREQLDYRPSIICIGAAIAFLTGDQASIPPLADRLCMGWLLRCLRHPRRFVPRYLAASRLVLLMLREIMGGKTVS